MISGRDQIEKVASQLANLRFLDDRLFDQPHHRDPALVCDLKALPRIERRGARLLSSLVFRLFLQTGQVFDDLSPRAARLRRS